MGFFHDSSEPAFGNKDYGVLSAVFKLIGGLGSILFGVKSRLRHCATRAVDFAFGVVSAFVTASPAYAPARPPSPAASCPYRCPRVLADLNLVC